MPAISTDNFSRDVERLALKIVAGYVAAHSRGEPRMVDPQEADLLRRIERQLRLQLGAGAGWAPSQAERAAVAMLLAGTLDAQSGGYADADMTEQALSQARSAANLLNPKADPEAWALAQMRVATMSFESAHVMPYPKAYTDADRLLKLRQLPGARIEEAKARLRSVVAATEGQPSSYTGAAARYYLAFLLGSQRVFSGVDIAAAQETVDTFAAAEKQFKDVGMPDMANQAKVNRAVALTVWPSNPPNDPREPRRAVALLDSVLADLDSTRNSKLWAFAMFKLAEAHYVVGERSSDATAARQSVALIDTLLKRSPPNGTTCDVVPKALVVMQLHASLISESLMTKVSAPALRSAGILRKEAEAVRDADPFQWGMYQFSAGAADFLAAKLDPNNADALARAITGFEAALTSPGFTQQGPNRSTLESELMKARAILAARGK
jgi:hypothetical protein